MRRDDAHAEFQAYTRAQALGSGLTRSQLDEGRTMRRIARNLHVPADQPDGLWERCRALRLVLPGDAVFSHYTAAALLRVPVPDEPLIHVCTAQAVEPRIGGVVAHRIRTLPETDVQSHYGLPITTPGRTFLDLAGRLDFLSLLIAGDPLARLDPRGVCGLAEAVARGTGRRGVRLARAALPLLDPASKSPAETKLRFLVVVTGGLPKPVCNAPVYDDGGEWLAEIDIQWPDILFGLEYEGAHHREQRQWELDIKRDENVRDIDWVVMKVTATDLYQRSAATLERIKDGYARQLKRHRRR